MERAHGDAPRELVKRGLGAQREIVHDDGARRGHREQRAVVGERQGVGGMQVGVQGQGLYNFCRRGSRGGMFDYVHHTPHGQYDCALVLYGEGH